MKKIIFIILLIIIILGIGRFFLFRKRESKIGKDYKEIKVEIINCSGRYEIGKEVLEALRKRGFNVYDVIFDRDTLPETFVVERSDEEGKNALIVAKGISGRKKKGIFRREVLIMPKIKKDINHNLFIDVSLILGRDFKIFFPEVVSEEEKVE